jgi:nucleolar protein 15
MAAARAEPKHSEAGDGKSEEASVLYVGRLPHGFYESELRNYFGQFGTVKRVRVSRSKKTARAKHYAFLEFASPVVCSIAASAMDGYVLMERALRCRPVPPSMLHPNALTGANRTFRTIPWTRIARDRHNRPRSPSGRSRLAKRIKQKQARKLRKIADAGIDYDFSPLLLNSASKSRSSFKKNKSDVANQHEPESSQRCDAAPREARTPSKSKLRKSSK